ncbi:MAG: hypothetical protein ACXV8O_13115 [Methylobacter sp.]
MDVEQYISDVLHKKPSKSKKWLMAIIGVSCVMMTFVIGVITCVVKPEVSQQISVLSGQVVTFLGALVGAYTTGQSFVDWKMQTNIESISNASLEEKDIETTERHIDVQSRAKESDYEIE